MPVHLVVLTGALRGYERDRLTEHPALQRFSPARAARRAEALAAAREQLRRYRDDSRVRQVLGAAQLHPLVLLYSGWELVQREEVAISSL